MRSMADSSPDLAMKGLGVWMGWAAGQCLVSVGGFSSKEKAVEIYFLLSRNFLE